MVGLLDIAPSTRTIPVGGKHVSVDGVSAEGIASLLSDFPELQALFTGGTKSFDTATIMKVAPKAIAAIIAAGTGTPGNPAAIKRAASLPVGTQIAFVSAIIEMTMPDGIGPFMEALEQTIANLDFGNRGKAPASN